MAIDEAGRHERTLGIDHHFVAGGDEALLAAPQARDPAVAPGPSLAVGPTQTMRPSSTSIAPSSMSE